MAKSLSMAYQKLRLQSLYAGCIESITINSHGLLLCIMHLKPTMNSMEYRVKLEMKRGHQPDVCLLSPELQTYKGKYPHHLYPDKHGRHRKLCIYDSRKGHQEYHGNMFLAETVIPWIISWLNTYELWLLTGKWHHAEVVGNKRND